MLVDTHVHVYLKEYDGDRDQVLTRAAQAGVAKLIVVGCNETESKQAVELAQAHDRLWASVGLHPHDAKYSQAAMDQITQLASEAKVAAIGECGLDYYYEHSPRAEQQASLRAQIELAQGLGKPLIFHVRDAFDDFLKIVDEYPGIRGVVHCFSADAPTLRQVLDRGLYVGFNGIMTFTKDQSQLEAAKACPADRMLLETDCPFLTPAPHRGQRNEPAHVRLVAEFLAQLRGESFEDIAAATTKNAEALFGI